jgi:hypothetical protein
MVEQVSSSLLSRAITGINKELNYVNRICDRFDSWSSIDLGKKETGKERRTKMRIFAIGVLKLVLAFIISILLLTVAHYANILEFPIISVKE